MREKEGRKSKREGQEEEEGGQGRERGIENDLRDISQPHEVASFTPIPCHYLISPFGTSLPSPFPLSPLPTSPLSFLLCPPPQPK